jgi:cytidylate kinase
VRDGILKEVAMENNRRRQAENKEVFETIYGIKNYPPESNEFDLIIDTEVLSLDKVVQEIQKNLNIVI